MAQRFEGTGLGLAISKNLAELMDGTISVASRLGVGSVFSLDVTFTIGPVDPACTTSDSASNTSLMSIVQDWKSLRGRKVLVVEDNVVNLEVARDLLEAVGMRVSIAADGVHVLQKLKSTQFDLVLMDMHMPVMDGLETARRIRQDAGFASLPVLALTASAHDSDRIRCIAAGMNDLVRKPIDPGQMYDAISRWLPAGAVSAADAPSREAAAPNLCPPYSREVSALKTIPGLGVEQGLKRVLGRNDLYVKLVRRVLAHRCDVPLRLRNAIGSGDLQAAHLLLHTTRSIMGTLGATGLEDRCIALETQLTIDVTDESMLTSFEEEYTALIETIKQRLALAVPEQE